MKQKEIEGEKEKRGKMGRMRRERSKKPLEPGYFSQDVGQQLTKEFSVTD